MLKPRQIYEKIYPYLLGLIGSGSVCLFFEINPSLVDKAISPSLTVSAIFIGFLATTMIFLLTVSGNKVVDQLKKSGHLKVYFNYIREAIGVNLLWTIVAIIGLCELNSMIMILWVFSGITSFATFYRVVSLQFQIFSE